MISRSAQVLLCIGVLFLSACSSPPVVVIDDERLVGFQHPETGVATFLGVPFAEPPLGDLRWRAPQALQAKQKTRQVKRFAPACMQAPRILEWYRDYAEIFGASRDAYEPLAVDEDCLYLNIWTPTLEPGARLPVMVYVHGGGNDAGWSYEIPYHGHQLAPQGVVVVTIAYRLGAFGFLSHPELEGDAVANFGLWDQVAALRWIQQNIAQFGGDPDRVMAFGESAGAEDVLALLIAGPAQGLIHRAALHSTAGFGLQQPTLEGERQRGSVLADLLQLGGPGTLAALRKFPAHKLMRVYDEAFADHYHSPAIDGQLVTESTWYSIKRGAAVDIPIIIGTNADEWLESVNQQATPDEVIKRANELEYIDHSVAIEAVSAEIDPRQALDRLITANNMLCPSQITAAEWTAHGGDAWSYFFTRVRDGEGGKQVGAFHGAEYTYVFGTNYVGMPVVETDRALLQTMMNYWISLASTGNPNTSSSPDWPEFVAPGYKVQELGDVVRTITRPEAAMCNTFDPSQETSR